MPPRRRQLQWPLAVPVTTRIPDGHDSDCGRSRRGSRPDTAGTAAGHGARFVTWRGLATSWPHDSDQCRACNARPPSALRAAGPGAGAGSRQAGHVPHGTRKHARTRAGRHANTRVRALAGGGIRAVDSDLTAESGVDSESCRHRPTPRTRVHRISNRRQGGQRRLEKDQSACTGGRCRVGRAAGEQMGEGGNAPHRFAGPGASVGSGSIAK